MINLKYKILNNPFFISKYIHRKIEHKISNSLDIKSGTIAIALSTYKAINKTL